MNIIIKNNIRYKYIFFWKANKTSRKLDSQGKSFPFPKEGKYWTNKKSFLSKLINVEQFLDNKRRFRYIVTNSNCLLCDNKNIATKTYRLNKFFWEDSISHYIKIHNIKPPKEFIEMIYNYDTHPLERDKRIKLKGQYYSISGLKYVKLDVNQIMILDALMRHGGYDKKYLDDKNKKIYRYSEHAGLLDFNHDGLERIIVSGNTNRVDVGDDEIFLPGDIKDVHDFEYIFHSHPSSPKPGGRASVGIIYEIPSISDILHFIDNFNAGLTQGSIVVTPEGLYNIHKYTFDKQKININEDNLIDDLSKTYKQIQQDAINKHGIKFSTYYFYSRIAQDVTFIKKINQVLKKYDLYIDYFSRTKDSKGRWIIDSIHLPIFIIEPSK